MVRMLAGVSVALALLGTQVSAAQEKATELTAGVIGVSYTTCSGCDGLFIATTGGAENGVFSGLGGGSVAVGFYLSPGLAFEPTVAFSTLSGGGETLTIFSAGAAVPFYLSKGWGRRGAYVAPRAAYNLITGGGSSASQLTAGAAIGTKVPLNDMAALRLQASFDYGFEGDFQSTTALGGLVGLSVFLR